MEIQTQIFELPKGPWTKDLRAFPDDFREESIISYRNTANEGVKKSHTLGYRLFKAGHVKNILLHYNSHKIFAKANISAAMKAVIYKSTWVVIDQSGAIEKGRCDCPGGIRGRCKHIFALLWKILDYKRDEQLYIADEKPCTSKARAWGTGSNIRKEVKPLREINFIKHDPLKKAKKNLENITKRRNIALQHELVLLTVTDLKNQATWFLKSNLNMLADVLKDNQFIPENNNHLRIASYVDQEISYIPMCAKWEKECYQIISLNNFTNAKELLSKCSLSFEEAKALEIKTRRQGNCQLWYSERSKRLTASKFGSVIKRKAKITDEFLNTIWPTNIIRTSIMKLGNDNEKNAIRKYINLMPGNIPYPCGLVFNPGIPFLAASPDQLIYNEASKNYYLLEIKTLVTGGLIKKMTILECVENNLATFLEVKDNKLSLKKNHAYYMQIQGQLAITGLEYCDLFVDAGEELFIQRIYFDEVQWTVEYLPSLTSFYFNYKEKNFK